MFAILLHNILYGDGFDGFGTDGIKTRVEVGLEVGIGLDEVDTTDGVDVEETEGEGLSPKKETKNRPA